jgi:threonine synthase
MKGLLERYAHWLPLDPGAPVAYLGEGNTPLVPSRWVGPQHGLPQLYFKLEQLNPTGSYKDRFAAMAISLLLQQGVSRFMATSSGNTGAALAAYAARYGLECNLLLNELTPEGKLSQMLAYGARLYRVRGFGLDSQTTAQVFGSLAQISQEYQLPLLVSAYCYSPQGMEGVKTLAYELVEQLPELKHIFSPVGGGGMLTAVVRGLADLGHPARVHAVQPELNDTMVTPLRQGSEKGRRVSTTTTLSGLAVPDDLDATAALQAVKRSGGWGFLVSDDRVRQLQAQMMACEGLFVEPAAVASVAGALEAVRQGHLDPTQPVVCILTGHGFKDPQAVALANQQRSVGFIEPQSLPATLRG